MSWACFINILDCNEGRFEFMMKLKVLDTKSGKGGKLFSWVVPLRVYIHGDTHTNQHKV